jgi:ABC-2 type transport system permease protein
VRSYVAFEEASADASRKVAERVAAIRANRGRLAAPAKKKKRAPFELKPAGPRTIGFLWKNLIGAGQMFTPRLWLAVALPALILGVSFGGSGNTPNAAMLIGIMSVMFLVMSFLMGPQLVRQDFRQDLPMADVLKTYPLPGWEVALGELLGPAAILTGVQWLLIILCAGLFRQFGDQAIQWNARVAIGSGLALVAPMLNLVTLIIPNATVLLFPGWFQTGKDAPQGIEAMGQRLIFALGQLVVFLLSLAPAAAVFSLIYFVASRFLGPWVPVPMAALSAAVILGAEAWMGMLWLGRLFTKFDLSSESGA